MSKVIDFYFDFGSPAAYLAWTQLPIIASDEDAELIYKPVLLGGIFQATRNASPVAIPAKASYMLRDLGRYAKRYGVPLKFSPYFPLNTLALMRMAIGTQQRRPQDFQPLVATLFRAMWADAANLGDPAVVREVIAKAGLDASAIQALAEDEAVKALLKQETDKAVQLGLFGLPAMVVGGELFWGQDRLDFVREALMQAP